MNLLICFCVFTVIYVIFKFLYIPYSREYKLKKNQKKIEEDLLKQQLMKCHPEFINMYTEFKLDQKEKRISGYYSDLMISEGGYVTNIYGKSIFVYDQYFEDCFYKKLETKYNELINDPHELEKVLKLNSQLAYPTNN